MRKIKEQKNKAVSTTFTLPMSLKRYITEKGKSKFIQQKIAEDVTGVTFGEFKVAYNYPNATSFRGVPLQMQQWVEEDDIIQVLKPESLEKAFIRMARWMLEGKLLATYRWGTGWLLLVEWDTGSRTHLVVDYKGSKFVRVCYDMELKDDDCIPTYDPAKTDYRIYSCNPFKSAIIARWAELSGFTIIGGEKEQQYGYGTYSFVKTVEG